jgi:hypothetical protein
LGIKLENKKMLYKQRNQPIQYINGNPYLIHGIWKLHQVTDVNSLKRYLGCTTVFKNDKEGVFYFCNEIEEAQIVDEVNI